MNRDITALTTTEQKPKNRNYTEAVILSASFIEIVAALHKRSDAASRNTSE